MKRYLSPLNLLYFLLLFAVLNSFLLVRRAPLWLLLLIPLFLALNLLPGMRPRGTKSLRLRLCNHGTLLLLLFLCSLLPALLFHTVLALLYFTELGAAFWFSVLYCAVGTALVFWNGILCVYLTSVQLGLKWRLLGALCGLVPVLNLALLFKLLAITADEIDFEIAKEQIARDPALAAICQTKYPILLVHGIFFRDSKLFNYWGRIPRALQAHGATVFYGNHQSALTVKESARELAARVRLITERSGCEKVNIIAHSKGGLDCRYAISEFGIAPLVASLTTVNTPHRGCLFAEKLLDSIPTKVQNKVAATYNRVLTALGDETPDFLAAVGDLTAGACEARNAVLTLPEGIYTQSIGSVMSHPRKGQFPLNLSYRYVKEFDGENDGLVGEGSFAWGERYTLLRTDGKRGISHGDVIDLNRENLRDFDVRDFYVTLVRELRERGL